MNRNGLWTYLTVLIEVNNILQYLDDMETYHAEHY